jgi:hypothetical protein
MYEHCGKEVARFNALSSIIAARVAGRNVADALDQPTVPTLRQVEVRQADFGVCARLP